MYTFLLHTQSAVEFQPVATFLGGIVAQEVIKLGGRYTPIDQWIHFDCIECLPSSPPQGDEGKSIGGILARYDGNVALFGRSIQRKLLRAKTFMVGCGALGCGK